MHCTRGSINGFHSFTSTPITSLRFLFTAFICCTEAVELPLIEASGAANGEVVVVGNFCAGVSGAVYNSTESVLYLLAGPTPHVVKTFNMPLVTQAIAHDTDGDGRPELVTSAGSAMTLHAFDSECATMTAVATTALPGDKKINMI